VRSHPIDNVAGGRCISFHLGIRSSEIAVSCRKILRVSRRLHLSRHILSSQGRQRSFLNILATLHCPIGFGGEIDSTRPAGAKPHPTAGT